jgi:hypothetical protein
MLTLAEWIMAGAALVQAAVVIALYGITRRDVALTARLASEEDLKAPRRLAAAVGPRSGIVPPMPEPWIG